MNINPSNLAAGPNPSADANQILRMNQRFSGEILQVAGDRVTVSIQGVPIVARMVSSDQTSQLADKKFATFVVKDANPNNILLQLLPQAIQNSSSTSTSSTTNNLATQVLRQMGIEFTKENLQIINSMLAHNLPLEKTLVAELRQVLDAYGEWGETEANIAAAMKQNAIPLSSGSLHLATRTLMFRLNESVGDLKSQLLLLLKNNPQFSIDIQNSLQFLNRLPIDLSTPVDQMTDQVRQSISNLYSSLERKLADLIHQGGMANLPEGDIFSLVKLRNILQSQGKTAIVEKIDQFLDGLRMMQLSNVSDSGTKNLDSHLTLKIPLQSQLGDTSPGITNQNDFDLTQMKIAFRRQPEGGKSSHNYQHLTIQVDIDQGKPLEVDLSIVGKQVVSKITSPDDQLDQLAQAEYPTLDQQLTQLGFIVLASRFDVGTVESFDLTQDISARNVPVFSVNKKA